MTISTTTLRTAVALPVAVAFVALGCNCGGGSAPSLGVATFNTGLAPANVDFTDERAPEVKLALEALDADVLCAQELWLNDDYEDVAALYPYVSHQSPMPVFTGCTAGDFAPIEACVDAACPGACGTALASCALSSCDAELGMVSGGCADCLYASVLGGACSADLWAACEGPGGEGYLFEGDFDTAIFSRLPILEAESLVLDSFLVRSAVDYALVDTPLGEVHVFCAHYATGLGPFAYEGDFGDWAGERSHQIEQTLAYVASKTYASDQVVVAGDLNVEAGSPDYARFVAAGLENPYLDQGDAACTSCPDNSLHEPTDPARIIDHVLVRGFDATPRYERLFTDTVDVDVGGTTTPMHLSDHYGLMLTLTGP